MVEIDPDVKLFLGDPNRETQAFLTRLWIPVGGMVVFGFGSIFANMVAKRPMLSGSHIHALSTIGGGLLGEWLYRKKEESVAERDAQYYHYMMLHPEDFPPPKKVLYRDYLEPWIPHR